MLIKRILMNAADAASGNGAPATPPVEVPANAPAPQAQGAPAATVSPDDFSKLLSTVGELAKSVNSLHAADRRTREGKQPEAGDKPKPPQTTEDILAIRDAFDDATSELKLTKDQRSLLREHVMARPRPPSDVDGVVSDYVKRAGWTAAPVPLATTAAPAAPVAPTAPTAPVVPNPPAAPSAPNGASLPKQNGITDLFSLTDAQRKDLGPAGVRAVLEELQKVGGQQAGIPQRPKPPAQR